jgi:hypothetical protein
LARPCLHNKAAAMLAKRILTMAMLGKIIA